MKNKGNLSNERIEELVSRAGARKTAVSNFLRSLYDMERWEAFANLEYDANMYRWNAATVNAIHDGLIEAYDGERREG